MCRSRSDLAVARKWNNTFAKFISPTSSRRLTLTPSAARRRNNSLGRHCASCCAAPGLQFFKVNKSTTHVAVARPHFLDLEATPVSEGVKRIVDYINAHSGCTRRQLIEALAPSAPRPAAPATPGPAEGAVVSEPIAEPVAPLAAPSSAAAPPSGDLQEPTAEQTVVIAD